MSSEPTELIPIPYRRARSTRYSYRLHDFPVTVPRFYKDVSTVLFLAHVGPAILRRQNAFL